MGLNETTKQMRDLLTNVSADLEKASLGNKAAAQRVRTQTIRLEKTAKNYRRESIQAEKSGNFPKRPSQMKKASAKAKPAMKPAKFKAAAKPAMAKRAPQKPSKPASKPAYRR